MNLPRNFCMVRQSKRSRGLRGPLQDTYSLESEWLRRVTKVAREIDWKPVHFPDSLKVTHPGLPDLILRHDTMPPYIIVLELKVGKNEPDDEQTLWLAAFEKAGVATMLAYPEDYDDVVRLLSGDASVLKERVRLYLQ